MILKRKTQNTLALSLTLFFLSFFVPNIIKSQSTIPSTTVTGCLKVNQTTSTGNLDVGGSGRIDSSLVVGDTMRAQDVIVTGNARIAGDVNVGGDLVFKNGTGISVTTNSITNNEIYSYGKAAIGASPSLNPCLNPNPPWQLHQFAGAFQVYDGTSSGYTGGSILSLQSWFNGSSIDVAGGNNLLVNYFCGKDVAVCTGSLGGTFFAGDKFRPSKNVQIGPHWQTLDPNVALDVYLSGTNSGLKLWSGGNQTAKLIHDNYDQFMVMGNGKTSIGVNATPGAMPYKTLTVNGDASFANYGHPTDGLNAFEIVGNNQTPLRRGISLDNDPNGNVTFWINSNQTPSSFKFKNGANLFDLMALDVNGKLFLTSYGTEAFEIKNFATSKVNFLVYSDGRTRIGPKRVGSRVGSMLTVSGEVDCMSLYVLKPVTWSDYVFNEKYKLNDLYAEEKFILQHGHLRGIPSEKEVLENGYDVNEMNAALLAKLEESYLHIFKLQKEVDELKKKIK